MIRGLRHRLVTVTMLLLTLVLALALCLMISSVYQVMEEDSLEALRHAGTDYGLHGKHSSESDPPPKPPSREDEKGPEQKPKKTKDDHPTPIPTARATMI